MKKKIVFVFLILFIASQFAFSYSRGYYNTTFKVIVCHSKENCLHEIGHAMDHSVGWVSESREYEVALNAYIMQGWNYPEYRDEFSEKVLFYPGFFIHKGKIKDPFSPGFWTGGWGGTTELYADMFAWTDGDPENMPVFFMDFYDWELAKKLIDKYIGDRDA